MSQKLKILIADDESIGRQLLEAILMPEGHDLILACDGKEALEKATSEIPDFILCDVMMPHMDGFEVCKHLRKNDITAHIPIFLITALDDRDSKLRGIDAGADDYISKPYDRVEILAKIKSSTARIQKRKDDGGTSNNESSSVASSKSSLFLQDKLIELLISTNSSNAQLYRSPIIPVKESKHCCISHHDQWLFVSNKLNDNEAALANCIFLSIWKNVLTCSEKPLNEVLINCSEELNALIQKDKLEMLTKAGFSMALLKHNKEINEVEACGVNQTIFIQSQDVMIGQTDSNSYQSYYLQGNQNLKFNKASSAIIISPNAFKTFDQQELLSIANSKLRGTHEGDFIKEISNTFKQSKDICAVKITF